jgi:predicted TIM-barrel fold metal-dependent hydrolase
MAGKLNLNWLISVDDHVLEPPDLWQKRVPKAMRDKAPRLVRDDAGEWWEYDGKRVPTPGLSAMAGKSKREFSPLPVTYAEMRPGCYDAAARVRDMDEAGILASLCFPSFPRFCGQVFAEGTDKELGLACIRAYNDWMIEDWSGSAPGRFIPLIIMPLWDAELAAAEIRRSAAMGALSVAFSENPVKLGLPSIYDPGKFWEPVWQACDETGMVVSIHIGSSSAYYWPSEISPQVVKYITSFPVGIAGAFVEWLFALPLQRYPNLKISLAEGGIGWLPYYLERSQYTVEQHRAWMSHFKKDAASIPGASNYEEVTAEQMGIPDLEHFDVREVFRNHIFGCFIDDIHGLKNIREIGVDNVMIETDYPHSDSTWPNSIQHAHKQLQAADLTDEEKFKVLRGNAERVFRFTPAEPPTLKSSLSD